MFYLVYFISYHTRSDKELAQTYDGPRHGSRGGVFNYFGCDGDNNPVLVKRRWESAAKYKRQRVILLRLSARGLGGFLLVCTMRTV